MFSLSFDARERPNRYAHASADRIADADADAGVSSPVLQHTDSDSDRRADAGSNAHRDRDAGADSIGDRKRHAVANVRADNDTIRNAESNAFSRKRTTKSRPRRRRIIWVDGDDRISRVDLARLPELIA